MNTQEVLKLANVARPDLITKTAAAIQELESLDKEAAQLATEHFQIILDVVLEKTAEGGFKDFGVAMGASAAAGLGAAVATDLYDVARRGLTKARNFKRIMEANPGLKSEVEDPKRLRPAFDTLHRYAPDFTADPLMGGAILKAMTNLPEGSEANFVSNLISSRKNLLDARSKQYSFDSHLGSHMVEKDKGKPGQQRLNKIRAATSNTYSRKTVP